MGEESIWGKKKRKSSKQLIAVIYGATIHVFHLCLYWKSRRGATPQFTECLRSEVTSRGRLVQLPCSSRGFRWKLDIY